MKTIQEIEKQFENAGIPEFKDNRNNALLSEKLHDNEIIEMASTARKEIIDGDIVGEMSVGLLLATNIRTFYINKGVMWGYSFEEFDYSKINSIEQIKGSLTTTIIISASDKSYGLNIHNSDVNHTERIISAIGKRIAQVNEKYLNYQKAIEFYDRIGEREEAARIREIITEQKAVKVTQKVVHGDEITSTTIKDSVVSKSNIGAGGKSKSEELRDAKALHDDGIIDDDEFKQMKQEILGKKVKKIIKKTKRGRVLGK